MILIDATSIMWLVIVVVWGYSLGLLIAEAVSNWWRVEHAVGEWWANLPLVANLRLRRDREEFNWWWVNATPEQRKQRLANTERLEKMTRAMSEIIAATGIAAKQATEAFAQFATAYQKAMAPDA